MIRCSIRRAVKAHYCDECHGVIAPGDRYRDLAASPHHDDLGNEGWWRLKDCAACSARRGKPIPAAAAEGAPQ